VEKEVKEERRVPKEKKIRSKRDSDFRCPNNKEN